MRVTKLTDYDFRVAMASDELTCFLQMAVTSENLAISDVSSLLKYLLTYCLEHSSTPTVGGLDHGHPGT